MEIEKLIEKQQKKLTKLQKLRVKYPDIKEFKNRWNHKYYVSKSVNSIADKVDFWHSCGCCSDAVFYANPYVEDKELKLNIYSDPMQICIGERCSGTETGEYIYEEWEENLKGHNVSENVIEQIRLKYCS